MSLHLIAHIMGGEVIEGELDELPPVGATYLTIKNPMKRGGHELAWVEGNALFLLIPLVHISSAQVLAERDAHTLEKKYPQADSYFDKRG